MEWHSEWTMQRSMWAKFSPSWDGGPCGGHPMLCGFCQFWRLTENELHWTFMRIRTLTKNGLWWNTNMPSWSPLLNALNFGFSQFSPQSTSDGPHLQQNQVKQPENHSNHEQNVCLSCLTILPGFWKLPHPSSANEQFWSLCSKSWMIEKTHHILHSTFPKTQFSKRQAILWAVRNAIDQWIFWWLKNCFSHSIAETFH